MLASAEHAERIADRGTGLLGRDGIEGAMVLDRTEWVHTIGMRFAIDVAHLDADGIVLRISAHAAATASAPVVREGRARGRGARAARSNAGACTLGDIVESRE